MSARQQPAPMLAAEGQQRGDNSARVTAELLDSGQDVSHHQAATRNAFTNAAKYGEQPERGDW